MSNSGKKNSNNINKNTNSDIDRSSINNKIGNNKIFFIIFILIWIVLIVINFILPKQNFSEQENRMLAKFPTFSFEKLTNGKYSEELNDYINDHFAFRNIWLKIKSTAEIATGKTQNNGVYIGSKRIFI